MISSAKLRSISFLVLLFSCFSLVAMGQTPKGKWAKGNRQFERLAYYKALKSYLKYNKKDPNNSEVILRIADCYRHMYMPEESEPWYREALFYPENKDDVQNIYYMIQALRINQKYDEAVVWLDEYLKRKPGDELGENLLESSLHYTDYLKDSSLYHIVNLDINTKESDFGPTMTDSVVIFSSAKDKDRFIFGWNGRYFLQLYKGDRMDEGVQLENVKAFKGRANTKFHEAIVTYTPDMKTMYFTRNNYHKGTRGTDDVGATLLKIYRSELNEKGKAKKVEGLHFNSDDYSVGHPSLSADGQTLYFASDMPGGYGATDIYKANWEGEDWGKPINLGPTINTFADEMFPWISPENVMYFASAGHPGLGGLDLFSSQLVGEGFSEPKNMGAPLNSSWDDFQLVVNWSQKVGYFSSNRRGGHGDDDIYSFIPRLAYKGLVVDKLTQDPIDNAFVQVRNGEQVRYMTYTDAEGYFAQGMDSIQDWDIYVVADGYQSEQVKVKAGEPVENGLFAKIELVRCGEFEMPQDTTTPGKVVLSGVIKDEAGNPIKKGKVRIIREIEVTDSKFSAPLQPGTDYIVEVEAPEYPTPRVYDISTNNDPNAEIPLEAIFDRDQLPPGRVFYIIYYDFDKYNIREPDARPELDRVVNFLQAYPDVTIEMSSHTDSRGTFQYNEVLSKNRAVSAFKYITGKGVGKDRLKYVWYGERVNATPCPDGIECSEPDHQLNRRTEFKILGWKNGFRSWDK